MSFSLKLNWTIYVDRKGRGTSRRRYKDEVQCLFPLVCIGVHLSQSRPKVKVWSNLFKDGFIVLF